MDMEAGFLIGFREALEAALIIGILITLLQRTNRQAMVHWVWGGVIAALVASVATWQAFFLIAGEFSRYNEELFEGILYLVAAVLITTVILQIFGHDTRQVLERKAEAAITRREALGMGLLSFVAVWREGVETVIFLGAGTQSDDAITGAVIDKSLPALKAISKYGIGLDKIDVNHATEKKLPILFTPGVNHTTVAEHTFGLLIMLAKHLQKQTNRCQCVASKGSETEVSDDGW